eukprot:3382288-Rhodomonas_salina.2
MEKKGAQYSEFAEFEDERSFDSTHRVSVVHLHPNRGLKAECAGGAVEYSDSHGSMSRESRPYRSDRADGKEKVRRGDALSHHVDDDQTEREGPDWYLLEAGNRPTSFGQHNRMRPWHEPSHSCTIIARKSRHAQDVS